MKDGAYRTDETNVVDGLLRGAFLAGAVAGAAGFFSSAEAEEEDDRG